nr:hypothetical protein [Sphingobium estronivorans]
MFDGKPVLLKMEKWRALGEFCSTVLNKQVKEGYVFLGVIAHQPAFDRQSIRPVRASKGQNSRRSDVAAQSAWRGRYAAGGCRTGARSQNQLSDLLFPVQGRSGSGSVRGKHCRVGPHGDGGGVRRQSQGTGRAISETSF